MARDDLLLEFLFGAVLENGTSADRNVKRDHHAFIKSLDIRERRLRFGTIPRRSLVDCRQSAFMRLYQSGSNQALIVVTPGLGCGLGGRHLGGLGVFGEVGEPSILLSDGQLRRHGRIIKMIETIK